MSVQSEINRINGEVADQKSLISQIKTALQGKAAAAPTLQSKTVTPTTAKQTVKPDSGYDGLSQVDVNAMPTATQATPSISVNSSGLITASATQSAGYVAAGTKSATKQLTTQAAKTITPSTSSQTAVAAGRYTTGAVTVGAIPDTYIQPSGTLDVTENGTHDVKNYASVNVNVAGSGGGGSVETCTITMTKTSTATSGDIYYTNKNFESISETLMGRTMSIEVEAIKNSIVYAHCGMGLSVTGACEVLYDDGFDCAFFVSGNVSVVIAPSGGGPA